MPKLGMEPIRRDALVKATIAEVGAAGSVVVSVGRIAARAGVSTALAHHYFGGKDQILLAAMRHILTLYGAAVRAALSGRRVPRDRLQALVEASFGPDNFDDGVISAWLTFYVRAQTVPEAGRLLRVYQRRLRSNLLHELRPLAGPRADELAETVGALIDGLYIRAALSRDVDGAAAAARVGRLIDGLLRDKTK